MNYIHDKQHMINALLTWYDANARILPWREEPTPYRVWVSEIMLQQTRVEAVKPYFERFVTTLPNLRALALADDDVLHKLWEGLGYYNRVKNMKKCAQYCMEHYDGKLPASYEALKQLPGIGDYTAGAIASIAFRLPYPAVDGNVLRVFSRLLVSEDDILKEATKKKFQKIIKTYIPVSRCEAFTQALMEIGAMICVPNAAPRCNICPLAMDCIGYQSHQAQRLPNKTKKKLRRIEKKTILVVVHEDKVLLHQRPMEGLLAGLYEFITLEEHYQQKDILTFLGADRVVNLTKLHTAKHIFSHVEWHMRGYLVEVREQLEGLWCTQKELEEHYALPSALKVYKDALYAWWRLSE